MSELLSCIIILPVRQKKYVLLYIGSKRRHSYYDVLGPDGLQLFSGLTWDEAEESCQLHYVRTTKFPRRTSKIKTKKVKLNPKQLERGNSIVDPSNLRELADYSFSAATTEFDLGRYVKSQEKMFV